MIDVLAKDVSEENVIVHATFFNLKGEKCECAGVLIWEDAEKVKIAFNAVDDTVIDSLVIQRKDLVSMAIISNQEIQSLDLR